VILQSAFTLPLPMDEAFDLLVDADAVASALPGARPAGPGASAGELDVNGDSAPPLTLRGHVSAGEHDRHAGSISFNAVGDEVDGEGKITASGAVRLRDAGGVTAVAIQIEVEASGRLGAEGPEAVEAIVRCLVDGLAAGLRERAGGYPAPALSVAVDTRAELEGRAAEIDREAAEAFGYEWMTAEEAAGAGDEAMPAYALVPGTIQAAHAAETAAAPVPARIRPVSPRPPRPDAPPRRREVAGRVQVVTSGAIPVAGIPVGDGPAARLHAVHRSRPWLIPAVLLGLLALLLLVRRREHRR
jgi:carbon monoxide dehydrogenase subunit G